MTFQAIAISAALGLALAGIARSEETNPGHLRMALVCMKCLYSDGADPAANRANLETNLRRHISFIERATAEGAEFVGFPELSVNGYHFSPTMTWLELTGPEVEKLRAAAIRKKIYVAAGIAERDADGKKWNTHFVIGPDGKIVGKHHKIWLTAERGHTEKGGDHEVFSVKGAKMGIATCADATDYNNLKALVDGGAKIIYGPHANTTGSTLAGWYKFRARWGGPADSALIRAKTSNDGPEAEMPAGGWVAKHQVFAALHNHAGLFHPDFEPPVASDTNNRFASGAWFIGPDGKTLAQMPSSTNPADSKEHLLIYNIPLK